jgi:Cu/Ag efflux pump CusA
MIERFISPCNEPTPHQREVATILIEECAEVIKECVEIQQRATKLLRFGIAEVQIDQPHDNAYRLGLEVGDLLEVLDLALAAGIFPAEAVAAGRHHKRAQLDRYMQTPLSKP